MQVEYAYLQHQQVEYPRHHYREYSESVCPDITSSTYLDYADDIVIFADLLDTLKDAMFIFKEQSQKTEATCQLVQDQASVLQPMDTHSTINTHRNTTCNNDRKVHKSWVHHRQ